MIFEKVNNFLKIFLCFPKRTRRKCLDKIYKYNNKEMYKFIIRWRIFFLDDYDLFFIILKI